MSDKGDPRKMLRRQRAAERLAAHVYNPKTCKPGCPKRPQTSKGVPDEGQIAQR